MYKLIQWPELLEFMNDEWFEKEAIKATHPNLGLAYFIPENRWRDKYACEAIVEMP